MSKKTIQALFSIVLMVGMLLSMAGQARAMETNSTPVQTGLQPQVSYALKHDVSAPLSEITPKGVDQTTENYQTPKMEIPREIKSELGLVEPDAALQDSPVTGNMPTLWRILTVYLTSLVGLPQIPMVILGMTQAQATNITSSG